MTEEIINSDGSRNWEANILLDNIKRLEQENKELKEKIKKYSVINEQDAKDYAILRNALEEIRHILEFHKDELEECLHNDIGGMIQKKINECIGE